VHAGWQIERGHTLQQDITDSAHDLDCVGAREKPKLLSASGRSRQVARGLHRLDSWLASLALSRSSPVVGFQLCKRLPELQANATVTVSVVWVVAVDDMPLRTTISPAEARSRIQTERLIPATSGRTWPFRTSSRQSSCQRPGSASPNPALRGSQRARKGIYLPLASFIAAQASLMPSAGLTAPATTLVHMSLKGVQKLPNSAAWGRG
jgi:hypothetical protein